MRLYLCVLLYALQCLATQTKRKYQDISVDDFAREQMNSLGGTISYGEMRHGLSPSMPAVKLEPTSTDAIYTTQLAPFGECFDASNHDFVVRHESAMRATFDVMVEFYDAACKVSEGQVLVNGPSVIEKMQASSFKIPRSKYDLYKGMSGMAKRLKSISIVNFSYIAHKKMFVFINTMIFLPNIDDEYDLVDEVFEMFVTNPQAMNEVSVVPVSTLSMSGGFQNFVNTCYIDSALSAMFMQTSSFDYLLLPLVDPNLDLQRLHMKFKEIINTIRRGQVVQKFAMKSLIKDMVANDWPFRYQYQEDVAEFITVFLEKFGAAVFTVMKQETYLDATQHLTTASQRMLFVPLPTNPTQEFSIYKLLSDSLHTKLTDVRRLVDGEEKLVEIEQTSRIVPALTTQYLFDRQEFTDAQFSHHEIIIPVQLVRFTATGQKLDTHIRIRAEMEVTDFFSTSLNTKYKFILQSVIVHDGTASQGHYTTFVKMQGTDVWWYYDDQVESRRVVNVKKIFELFARNAYVLFYKLEKC